ncbi:alkaline phosphatase family protein [Sphingomonas sp.]|uniref:alkaline phosphatase family protein n=1 Tax=Sphingomonas sp. TaxID=28214 RepID=UPI002DD68677|nr:ectonucleotide pyrophosphatase/phosphodiesterase [Sphingomonas sp.]
MRPTSALFLLFAALAGCAGASAPRHPAAPSTLAADAAEQRAPVTILISIDGFRPDYLDRGITPSLSQLAAAGVRAEMRPSFPSKTFPNHWTVVTGLRPDRNGIVSNRIEDPEGKRRAFTMATDDPWWWNAAPPVWVDAEKAGIRTAAMFWPGSNVAVGGTRDDQWPNDITGGVRPDDWVPFSGYVDDRQRVDTVVDWLRRPATSRPRFVTLYFDIVDTAGHRFGPNDPRTDAAIAEADAAVGALVAQLVALRQPADILITSDHGMAQVTGDRIVQVRDLASPEDGRVVEDGVFASFAPLPGREAQLAASLSRSRPHVQCWPKEQIPARFHYGRNPRVPPWFCLADPGWRIVEGKPNREEGGEHGYDNDAPDMRALFIASGPAFRRGVTLPSFDNVDIYPLLRRLLGLPPATDVDGSDAAFDDALTR